MAMKRRCRFTCTVQSHSRQGWLFALLLMMLMLAVVLEACVPSCQCTMVTPSKKKQKGRRVECSKHPAPFTTLAHISFPPDTVHLDLTQNKLTILRERSFIELSMLRKLNLSSNQITIIEPGAFEGLQNLRYLDLASNNIGTVNSSMFTGLPKLEKLWLNDNRINTIPDGTFNDLTALRTIDFGSPYLQCDCHLQWVVQWAESKKVRLARTTVCALPSPMQGRVLRKLSTDQLHCGHDLQLPVFEIKPSHSQLVFEGDKLPFVCRASFVYGRTQIAWVRDGGKIVIETNKTAGIFVHTSYTPDRTLISHSLVVENLDKSHEGIWSCQVTTPDGTVTKNVEVEVLSYVGISCPRTIQVTPKGKYVFEEMVAGVKAKQPCQVGGLDKFVTYQCDSQGQWHELNTSECAFTSDFTRNLQKLAQEDVNATEIPGYLQRLLRVVLTPKQRLPPDLTSIDVHYLASILQHRLLPMAVSSSEVAETLVDMVSNLTTASHSVIMQAQIDSQASKRVLDVLQNLTKSIQVEADMQEKSFNSRNIAIVLLRDIPVMASRVHCSLRSSRPSYSLFASRVLSCSRLGNSTMNRLLWSETDTNNAIFKAFTFYDLLGLDRRLECVPVEKHEPDCLYMHHTFIPKNTDVAIDLPSTLLQDAGVLNENSTSVFISVFRNGRLFPVLTPKHADPSLVRGNWTVASSVLSLSVGHPVPNLTAPVVLVLRTNDNNKPQKAVYWDFSANGGLGDWRTDGCEIIERKANHTVIHVYHLSYFAILQDVSQKPLLLLMEPVIYVGSGMCILCVMAVLVTYISGFRIIMIPKKMKHSITNICLALVLLLLTFILGINRVDVQLPCQVTGICLHYLTLAITFWITITANNMYKKFTKSNRPPSPPPEPVSMPLPPKPILRFYFLGWGVPIIICGITAAVNLNHYQSTEYCFLSWEPSLGAFYAPMGLLIILNLIFFMRISCVVRASGGSSLNESDETEEVHTNEIELVPSQADTNLEVQSVTNETDNSAVTNNNHHHRRHRNGVGSSPCVQRSAAGGSSRSTGGGDAEEDEEEEDKQSTCSLPDAERRPITQLRALVAMLFLYIVMWVCGALAVASPFVGIIPYQRLIFSYLYGLSSALFGIFMLTYFCLTRQDSQAMWKRFLGFGPPVEYSGPVSTELQTTSEPSAQASQPNGSVVKSNSNMDMSMYSQKSSNITKACNIKNNMSKQTNNSIINLVSMPASSLTEVSLSSTQEGYPNFYNPRQNGAARKFWQKNRQHKVLNKDMNKDINSSLTDNASLAELSHQPSQETESDGNTHLSIEIQIQSKEGVPNQSGTGYDPAMSNSNLLRHNHSGMQPYQHINNTTTAALISAHPSSNSPFGYRPDQSLYTRGAHSPSPGRSRTSPAGPQTVTSTGQQQAPPHHQRTSSSGSVTPHSSAFTPVQPRNNTLPRQNKADVETNMLSSPPSENMVTPENCGVFIDGPSQGQYQSIDSCVHPPYLTPHPCNIPVNHPYSQYLPPHALPRSISPVVQSVTHGFIYLPPRPLRSPASSHHTQPLSGDSSDASSRHRRHSRYSNHSSSYNHTNRSSGCGGGGGGGGGAGSSIIDGSKSPVMSDVTATPPSYDGRWIAQDSDSQGQEKKIRPMESDHHSDPTHRKKHRSRDKYGHRRGPGGMTKQRSLGWEEQFKGRPHKVAYAYVNHNYRDKVMHKLIKQASESDELAKKAFWLPRSLSEYDRLTQMGFCNMVEDMSSSSEEDSIDNVWVLHREGADAFKKETSV